MRIIGVASALPESRYRQEQITDALARHWGSTLRQPELLRRIHSRVGVKERRLAFSLNEYVGLRTWGQANAAWLKVAERLAADAIDAALSRSGLRHSDIDSLYVVSITGIASPSLDARLINRMGLRSDVKRTPIFGLGCVGGATGLVRAADYVRAFPNEISVLLAVEVCSLTIQPDDLSTANLIATGLFADGAVAAVLAGNRGEFDGPEVLCTKSVFYPGTEEMLGWDISERGLRVILSPKLPDLIRSRFGSDVGCFLAENGLHKEDIGSWAIHPGGPRILEAVECALGLRHSELEVSWDCLARFGNLSSGSVLQVLEETMTGRRPPTDTLGVIAAMGPGFCAELLLVRW